MDKSIEKKGTSVFSNALIWFGAAVELAVAMPLSWLPLISDYTREAEKPLKATLVSVLVYSAVSCFMYTIGMGAAIYTGEYDIATIMVKAGFGVNSVPLPHCSCSCQGKQEQVVSVRRNNTME